MGATCVLPIVASLTGRAVGFTDLLIQLKKKDCIMHTLRPVNDATEGSTQEAQMRAS